ncbi:MAG: hypothetical protein LLG14_25280 [Nocardiaceae bacterium]|nr:hypothetical protein [Nocardiaceae bacterium]
MAYGDEFSDADLGAMLGEVGDIPASVFESMISYATDPSTPLADVALIPPADEYLVDDEWDADDEDGSLGSTTNDDDDHGDYAHHHDDGHDDSDDDYSDEY